MIFLYVQQKSFWNDFFFFSGLFRGLLADRVKEFFGPCFVCTPLEKQGCRKYVHNLTSQTQHIEEGTEGKTSSPRGGSEHKKSLCFINSNDQAGFFS